MLTLAAIAVAYSLGQYGLALLILVASGTNGWLAVARSYVNPSWYWQRVAVAGMSPVDPGAGIRNLLRVKIILLGYQVPLGLYLWQMWASG